MPAPDLATTEWRVTAQHIDGAWLGWNVKVFVRALKTGEEPGPWRVIRDVTYKVPSGQVRHDYWKDILKAAAR